MYKLKIKKAVWPGVELTILVTLSCDIRCRNHIATKRFALSLPVWNFLLL